MKPIALFTRPLTFVRESCGLVQPSLVNALKLRPFDKLWANGMLVIAKTGLIALSLTSLPAYAEETDKPSPKEEWNDTSLSDDTIQKIQQAQYTYKKCVTDTMQKPDFSKLESRNATDAIIKLCEPVLAEMRKVYTDTNVPGPVADRHLKSLRIRVTRNLLQELMYIEAAKKSGQP